MEKYNLTMLTEFILMGITYHAELQVPLFGLFLIIYLTSLVGNLGMIILTMMDCRLQTPMYFFLRHLATTDLGYSTAVGPKMLSNFLVDQNTISFQDCAIQSAFFSMFIVSEFFILSAMSYDHYVAICKPLLYTIIMSQKVCWILVTIPYLYSIIVSLLVNIKIFTLSFCGYNVINHFYCDALPLLSLACSNTHEIEVIILVFSAFNLLLSLLIVIGSYLLILKAILSINSVEGKRKAFSTCGSHLTVVIVFYGTLIFMYLQPASTHSIDSNKVTSIFFFFFGSFFFFSELGIEPRALRFLGKRSTTELNPNPVTSIFYTQVIPMLNPLIYSLRNKDVKDALKKNNGESTQSCLVQFLYC